MKRNPFKKKANDLVAHLKTMRDEIDELLKPDEQDDEDDEDE